MASGLHVLRFLDRIGTARVDVEGHLWTAGALRRRPTRSPERRQSRAAPSRSLLPRRAAYPSDAIFTLEPLSVRSGSKDRAGATHLVCDALAHAEPYLTNPGCHAARYGTARRGPLP